ncbi:YjcZ family sporulation protein [Neobacillus sp. PS3-34]|uniref:YjcZ family sporulation protein n=1 Tax=Neobacillus sp. PS3-34 TaxID=3070678 RepID=UPI0027E1F6B2|nr:YjcZ family sporulation protein [Neobacillus sp. PS3-34]WML47844.1 YjcZ family sporulation protein [Neobacillus sp. PS3-34]
MYYGYDTCGCSSPYVGYGYGCAVPRHGGFALIVVLFILLIIVGASCFSTC